MAVNSPTTNEAFKADTAKMSTPENNPTIDANANSSADGSSIQPTTNTSGPAAFFDTAKQHANTFKDLVIAKYHAHKPADTTIDTLLDHTDSVGMLVQSTVTMGLSVAVFLYYTYKMHNDIHELTTSPADRIAEGYQPATISNVALVYTALVLAAAHAFSIIDPAGKAGVAFKDRAMRGVNRCLGVQLGLMVLLGGFALMDLAARGLY